MRNDEKNVNRQNLISHFIAPEIPLCMQRGPTTTNDSIQKYASKLGFLINLSIRVQNTGAKEKCKEKKAVVRIDPKMEPRKKSPIVVIKHNDGTHRYRIPREIARQQAKDFRVFLNQELSCQ